MTEEEMLRVVRNRSKEAGIPSEYDVEVMGKKIPVPVRYTNASAFLLLFSISYKQAQKMLKSNIVTPVRWFGDRSLLEVTLFKYQDEPVDLYYESTFSIPVIHKKTLQLPVVPVLLESFFKSYGHYVFLMGVDSPFSRKHIEEIFPYPLYQKDLDIFLERNNSLITGHIKDKSENIFSFKAKKTTGHTLAHKRFMTYYKVDDTIHNVHLNTFSFSKYIFQTHDIEICLGNHEISMMLTALEINKKPIVGIDFLKAVEIASGPKQIQ